MATKSGQHEPGKAALAEELIEALDAALDRVRILYEQYFLGIQKQPPTYLHTDIERKIREIAKLAVRNTAQRYRFAMLQQKFGSYNTYWHRTLRQIESGTYLRNLSKIGRQAARTGAVVPEEILAAMPKRMREQVKRDREAVLALAELHHRASGDLELVKLVDEDVDIGVLDAPSVIRPSTELRHDPLTAGGAPRTYNIDASDADFDLDAYFAEITSEGEPSPPVSLGQAASARPLAPPGPSAGQPSGDRSRGDWQGIGPSTRLPMQPPPSPGRPSPGQPSGQWPSSRGPSGGPPTLRLSGLPAGGSTAGPSTGQPSMDAGQAPAEPSSAGAGPPGRGAGPLKSGAEPPSAERPRAGHLNIRPLHTGQATVRLWGPSAGQPGAEPASVDAGQAPAEPPATGDGQPGPGAGPPGADRPSSGQPSSGQPNARRPTVPLWSVSAVQPGTESSGAGPPGSVAGQPGAELPSAELPSAGEPIIGQMLDGQVTARMWIPSAGPPSAGPPPAPPIEVRPILPKVVTPPTIKPPSPQAVPRRSGPPPSPIVPRDPRLPPTPAPLPATRPIPASPGAPVARASSVVETIAGSLPRIPSLPALPNEPRDAGGARPSAAHRVASPELPAQLADRTPSSRPAGSQASPGPERAPSGGPPPVPSGVRPPPVPAANRVAPARAVPNQALPAPAQAPSNDRAPMLSSEQPPPPRAPSPPRLPSPPRPPKP